MKDNLIIYVSSRNNYDMFKGEVLKNINFEGFEFINVDDNSCKEEIIKGEKICKDHNITFLKNKSRGVQMATQTLIDFINSERPNCRWIICFQHDVIPLSKDFFSSIDVLIEKNSLINFGAIGFNVLDRGKYTKKSLVEFNKGNQPLGMIGLSHLGISSPSKRWISPHHNNIAVRNPEKWSEPFIIEFPAWMVIGINVDIWNQTITPTNKYQFHLWFPDIAMQLNKNNKPLLVIPYLYCLNQQEVKSKYGIGTNSAHEAKKANEYHFGKYSNFKAWKDRWGWEYENARKTFPKVKEQYTGTLLYEFYEHNVNNGPLKTYKL